MVLHKVEIRGREPEFQEISGVFEHQNAFDIAEIYKKHHDPDYPIPLSNGLWYNLNEDYVIKIDLEK